MEKRSLPMHSIWTYPPGPLKLSILPKTQLEYWSCCYTLTFRILHFEVYNILKCKNFLVGFLDEFKQKFFFLHFKI